MHKILVIVDTKIGLQTNRQRSFCCFLTTQRGDNLLRPTKIQFNQRLRQNLFRFQLKKVKVRIGSKIYQLPPIFIWPYVIFEQLYLHPSRLCWMQLQLLQMKRNSMRWSWFLASILSFILFSMVFSLIANSNTTLIAKSPSNQSFTSSSQPKPKVARMLKDNPQCVGFGLFMIW